MKEAIVSKAYAKSIYQLGKEQSIDVAEELTKLSQVINENNNLETVLFLEVFTVEEKASVMDEVIRKLGLSSLSKNIINFLLTEKRIGLFPMIFKDLIVLDDHSRGFLKGVIEGRGDEISSEDKEKLTEYLKTKLGQNPSLEYKKNENLTAGYRVTVEDLQLDASLDNQLNNFKTEILNS
jgi:F-type H+-transporting ATPase subunit delta